MEKKKHLVASENNFCCFLFLKRVSRQATIHGQPVASLPQPPVLPTQVPAVLPQQPAVQVSGVLPQQPARQVPAVLAQQQSVQPAAANVQGLAIGVQPQVQRPAAPTIQQPQNPFLQASLYEAMKDQGGDGGVTMDDLGNVMLAQGRSIMRYRGPNASDQIQRHLSRR